MSVSLVVVGLSHKTAPVELREKAALDGAAARMLLRRLAGAPCNREALVLSTCNRTEVFAVGDDLEACRREITAGLVARSRVTASELELAGYVHAADRAVAHAFRVASSLDSMVVGESEIQGQVRAAVEQATAEGTLGPVLGSLFRQALRVGRRVRRETRIGHGAASVPSVAVDLAHEVFTDLRFRRALLIGAGRMAEATAGALLRHGLVELTVANRTAGTATALAARLGGRAVTLARLAPELRRADIVISSTNAPQTLLDRRDVERATAGRSRRMVLIDIAVPRDLDARIREVPGALLYDLDDLERFVMANVRGRTREAQRAERLVAEEVQRFGGLNRRARAGPVRGA